MYVCVCVCVCGVGLMCPGMLLHMSSDMILEVAGYQLMAGEAVTMLCSPWQTIH